MGYTEGPWFKWLRNPETQMLHVGPSWHSVAWIIQVDDQDANANLMAKSPEMLVMLERILDGARQITDGPEEAYLDVSGVSLEELEKLVREAKGEKHEKTRAVCCRPWWPAGFRHSCQCHQLSAR